MLNGVLSRLFFRNGFSISLYCGPKLDILSLAHSCIGLPPNRIHKFAGLRIDPIPPAKGQHPCKLAHGPYFQPEKPPETLSNVNLKQTLEDFISEEKRTTWQH